MPFPQLSKAWTISANVRQTYTTLLGVMGWFAYENKTRMLAVGWTVKFSSNGTIGPTGPTDTTDRVTSPGTFATRATVAAAAQAWFVLQNIEGVQILFTYQGATDDVMRISYSPAGLFTLAGTTTHQPTATDEVIMTNVTTVINNGTSLDRVMSIFCASDTTAWRVCLFRNGTLIIALSLDKVARIALPALLPVPYVFGNFVKTNREWTADDGVGNVMTPTYPDMIAISIGSSYRGWGTRVFTAGASRLCRVYGATVLMTDATAVSNALLAMTTLATFTASLGGLGALVWPIVLWGEKTANLDGPWASAVDWYQMATTTLTSPALGVMIPGLEVGDNPVSDPARTNWFVALGAATIWPWRDAGPSLELL